MIQLLRLKNDRKIDLNWVDGMVENIRPHVFTRERDRLLILMPNQAYRLNDTAFRLLDCMLKGMSISQTVDEILPSGHQTDERLEEIRDFFCDVRALVIGCLNEGIGHNGVEQTAFKFEESLLPVLSEIAVTYQCNLACKFCYAGCGCTSEPDIDEMTAEQIIAVLHKIRHEAEVPSVSFTGGEPTLRDDLCDLVRAATDLGLRVNLITNGTLITPELAENLRQAGLRSAQVSIEGPNATVHDALTTVYGSFEESVAGLKCLRDEGIYVHTNTTISRLNADHLPGMADLAASLGLERLSMNMVMPCGNTDLDETALRYTEVGDLVKEVRRRARKVGVEFMWYSPTPYCIFNPIAGGLGSKACAACDGLLSVAPNGDVLPCSSLMKPVGNLLRDDFETVWYSDKARYYRTRKHAPDTCRDCTSFDICSGACPIYWDALGCEEIDLRKRGGRDG